MLAPDLVEKWKAELPVLPDARKTAYMRDYGLTGYAAEQLVSDKALADYFEAAAKSTTAPKTAANLMITEVFRLLEGEDAVIPIAPAHLGRVAELAETGAIHSGAAKKVVAALWEHDEDPEAYVERAGLRQQSDEDVLRGYVHRALEEHPDMVESYRRGKVNLKKALMGAAMGLSGGMANPAVLQQLMDEALEQ